MDRITDINGNVSSTLPPVPSFPPGSAQGFFQERNPGTGAGATDIRGYWLNMAGEELRNPVVASGQTPSAASVTQLLTAILRLAAANASAAISSSATLTLDNAGVVYVNAAGGSLTITMPASNALSGATLSFTLVRTDASSNVVTLAFQSGQTSNLGSAPTLHVGETLTLLSQGTAWFVSSSGYAGSNANGNFSVAPDGTVRQWGRTTIPASGTAATNHNQTLPIPFPNSCDAVVASAMNNADSSGSLPATGCFTATLTQINIAIDTLNGNASPPVKVTQPVVVSWIALGK